MNIIICKDCGKKYAYKVQGTVYPGGKERETASCPYCGVVGYSEMTSQNISSYKLNEEEGSISKKAKTKLR